MDGCVGDLSEGGVDKSLCLLLRGQRGVIACVLKSELINHRMNLPDWMMVSLFDCILVASFTGQQFSLHASSVYFQSVGLLIAEAGELSPKGGHHKID